MRGNEKRAAMAVMAAKLQQLMTGLVELEAERLDERLVHKVVYAVNMLEQGVSKVKLPLLPGVVVRNGKH